MKASRVELDQNELEERDRRYCESEGNGKSDGTRVVVKRGY